MPDRALPVPDKKGHQTQTRAVTISAFKYADNLSLFSKFQKMRDGLARTPEAGLK